MALYEIKHRRTGEVLFSLECGSLRLCLEAAVSAGADLTGANLVGADLTGAYLTGANLVGADLTGANLVGADLARADLARANLARADLACAYLTGAYLTGAYLIDAGQERRGYRFWAWHSSDGVVVYRAGCHEWRDISQARDWYGDGYTSNGDRAECLARINFMHDEAKRRWPTESKQEVA